MLNLSEQWKKAYAEYLIEDSNNLNEDIDKVFVELSEIHDEVQRGFKLVESYFEIYNLSEGISLTEEPGNADVGPHNTRPQDVRDDRLSRDTQTNVNDVLVNLLKSGFADGFDDKKDYAPVATYSVQSIGDMKFPNNIIFFVKQLIAWIGKVVLYFIERFKNIIRRLLGDHNSVTEIDMNKLKLNLANSKKIEGISTTFSLGKNYNNQAVSARMVDAGKVDVLSEGLTDLILASNKNANNSEMVRTERVVVTLDLSRDIENLKLLVQHFYDLFDNAFGSFNEKLFDADDLKVILELFNDTLKSIKTGDPAREISLGGNATEVNAINSSRVRENLVTTNANINAIKQAYTQTAAKIKDISKIINSKELLMLTDLGVQYKMLTSATLTQMMPLMKSIPVRLKEASKMEKELEKVRRQYEELTKRLAEVQKSVMSLSNITYSTGYARRLNDLFISARYMTDIVTLRLSGLALYIKELKDVRDVLVQLNGVNANLSK